MIVTVLAVLTQMSHVGFDKQNTMLIILVNYRVQSILHKGLAMQDTTCDRIVERESTYWGMHDV